MFSLCEKPLTMRMMVVNAADSRLIVGCEAVQPLPTDSTPLHVGYVGYTDLTLQVITCSLCRLHTRLCRLYRQYYTSKLSYILDRLVNATFKLQYPFFYSSVN